MGEIETKTYFDHIILIYFLSCILKQSTFIQIEDKWIANLDNHQHLRIIMGKDKL
jgi:hypothetical protein